MRTVGKLILALALLLSATAVSAAEPGIVLRAGELKAQPFIDAATTDKVAANQPVNIVRRQGGWVQVESNGKTGWLRTLNLRMAAGSMPSLPMRAASSNGTQAGSSQSAAASPRANPGKGNAKPGLASLLHTGSSGKTETTGIKGLGEEDIKNATVDPVQLAMLSTLAVDAAEATANAQKSGLKENTLDYLDTDKSKDKAKASRK